jgi:hypothetical protein
MLDISQRLVGVGWVEVMIMIMIMIMIRVIMIRVIMMEVIVVVVVTILKEEPALHSRGVATRPCRRCKVCGGDCQRLFDGIWMK